MKPGQTTAQYAQGILLLLVVVFLWVCSGFIMNSMFSQEGGNYDKPFMTTYLCTSTFTLYLLSSPVTKLYRKLQYKVFKFNSSTQIHTDPTRGFYDPVYSAAEDDPQSDTHIDLPATTSTATTPLPKLTNRETIQLAAMFCALWFVANWANNAALGLTSVSSTTILCSTSGFITLAFGTILGIERFDKVKLAAVIFSLVGVIFVTKADERIQEDNNPHHRVPTHGFLGDLVALASAFAYACYVLLVKYRVGDESRMDIQKFFGYVGLFNTLFLWPFLLLLHYTKVETFERPRGAILLAQILVNMFITFISDLLYIIGMLKTGPVTATLALSLTIPLTILGDIYRGTKLGGLMTFVGALFVLGGFIVVGWVDRSEIRNNNNHDNKVQDYNRVDQTEADVPEPR